MLVLYCVCFDANKYSQSDSQSAEGLGDRNRRSSVDYIQHRSIIFALHTRRLLLQSGKVSNNDFYRATLASAVYAVVVCLSVCLPQAGIVSKPLNTESRKQRSTI